MSPETGERRAIENGAYNYAMVHCKIRSTVETVLSHLCALIPTVCAGAAVAQIYSLADLNTEQIRQLDRARTVVIIPGGIMEEHGP